MLALLAGLPGSAIAIALLWIGEYSNGLRWTLGVSIALAWIALAWYLRVRVSRPLSTVSSVLTALREGDFSIRAPVAAAGDPLVLEVNALERVLREQRLGAVEATNLLRRVLAEIDVAVVAFDAERRVRLANKAAERLAWRTSDRQVTATLTASKLDSSDNVARRSRRLAARPENDGLVGATAAEVGLEETLEGGTPRTIERPDPAGSRRWQVRRSVIRLEGERLTLVVMTDLSKALRAEERQAWRRLVRVLSHEINNSLAPISSISASIRDLVRREPAPEWAEDAERGLEIVSSRAESLRRFMAAYARLARLLPPVFADVEVESWISHVATLETRLAVKVRDGPSITARADRDQLEQALINLVANAVDATLSTGGNVDVGWSVVGDTVEVLVRDEGTGVADTANLFVPFYTTKPDGTGVGLALSRQIAENHGGSLKLDNRSDRRGAEARLVLPVGGDV